MSSAASLKAFLKEKKARDDELGRLGGKEEKIKRRLIAIRGLFDSVESWLKPSVDEGSPSLRGAPIPIPTNSLASSPRSA